MDAEMNDKLDRIKADLDKTQYENDLKMFDSLDRRWVIPVRTEREKEDA